MTPELSRSIDVRQLPERLHVTTSEAERAALAARLGIEAIERLEAEVEFERAGDAIVARGRIEADLVQLCAVSAEPFPTRVSEPLELRFVREWTDPAADEEIELDSDAADEISFEGNHFDLGEALAQSLALAIDPYATGPDADRVRKEAGLADQPATAAFAALAALKK